MAIRSTEKHFHTCFAALVSSYGLEAKFGLARARRWPVLPAGHVYLETEDQDRSLTIVPAPDYEHPKAINSVWHVSVDAHGAPHFCAVQPCVHQDEMDAEDAWSTHPAAYPAFSRDVLALFQTHAVMGDYAITRVHRHFGMRDDEVVLEQADEQTNSTRLILVSANTAHDADAHAWQVDSSGHESELVAIHLVARSPRMASSALV